MRVTGYAQFIADLNEELGHWDTDNNTTVRGDRVRDMKIDDFDCRDIKRIKEEWDSNNILGENY